MLELFLCSLLTVFPDYLYRSRVQGKRWGREITFFSMWYELRVGITACLLLTISLITLIFYYHPATTNVTLAFRTVTLLPESGGRVEEVLVVNNQSVAAGAVLARLDDDAEQAALEAARQQRAEAEAEATVAISDLAAAEGQFENAQGSFDQAQEELATRQELLARNPDIVNEREIERLEAAVEGRLGALNAAQAQIEAVETRIATLLPARLAAAQAQVDAAQVALDKKVIRAGVAGRVQQFVLQPGDFVSPLLRPVGLLVPEGSGRTRVQAGFDQIAAQVVRPGVLAEISCYSRPFTVIPMVIVEVQDVIAAGQIRPADTLIDLQDTGPPGTITAFMEPLYPDGLQGVPPGSRCVANAYTSNHERLATEEMGLGTFLFLHMVDTVGLLHALVLRLQTLVFPVQTLVLTGH